MVLVLNASIVRGLGTLNPINDIVNGHDAERELANGLTFGTSTAHLTFGGYATPPSWTPLHATASDAHGKVPLLTDANFRTLMRAYIWIAYGDSVSRLDIPGLTPGRTYRLQLVSVNPANCTVSLEGGSAVTWSGTTPSVLPFTWTAGDTEANVVLSRGAGQDEIDFNAYALHDMAPVPPAASTNLVALPGNQSVGLTWTGASGATGYKVWTSNNINRL
jgi:hypothetical protein